MKRIFLDIETLPTIEPNRAFVERKLTKSLIRKAELAGADELAGKAEIAFKDTALHGSLGRLLCIGLIVEVDGAVLHEGVFGRNCQTLEFHLDEADTLGKFWNYLHKIDFNPNTDCLVGHNILGFDLPFLYQRSMVCGVKPSWNLLHGKPWEISEYIFDTMETWKMGNYKFNISLEELALSFGLRCPKVGTVCGENLFEAFLQQKHEEIREYCLADVRCVRELSYRMRFQPMPLTKSAAV